LRAQSGRLHRLRLDDRHPAVAAERPVRAPGRQGMTAQAQLLRANRMKVWEPVFWLLAVAAPLVVPSHAAMVNEVAIVGLFAVSLDLVLGYTGIVSLGHAAFFGFGAYSAALMCKHVTPDPHIGLLAAMGASALLGL